MVAELEEMEKRVSSLKEEVADHRKEVERLKAKYEPEPP